MKLTWNGLGFLWPKRRPIVLTCLGVLLAAPAVLSPTHPIAVYGFLADTYGAPLKNEAFASVNSDLSQFLTSERQVSLYRKDLRADVADTRSGKFFVIARRANGRLYQNEIRTWNDFLPAGMSPSIDAWLDRKEFPFLGDEVEVWLRGDRIEAVGHYHAYGGPPSDGDAWAERFTGLPEVVVVNGLIPFVYMNRELVEYGHDIKVSWGVFRKMRSLEPCIQMDVRGEFMFPAAPTPSLKSFLGFLKEYRKTDIGSLEDIGASVAQLCDEMEAQYTGVFENGYCSADYRRGDPDVFNFLSRLGDLRCWAGMQTPNSHAEFVSASMPAQQ